MHIRETGGESAVLLNNSYVFTTQAYALTLSTSAYAPAYSDVSRVSRGTIIATHNCIAHNITTV